MKRIVKLLALVTVGIVSLAGLASCSSTPNMTAYVAVTFEGKDTQGKASYTVDEEKLLKDVLNFDAEKALLDKEIIKEAEALLEAYTIKLDKEENLSNGEKIKLTISVDNEKTNKIIGGEKEIEVVGLEELKKLTSAEVEKNLVISVAGVSSRGKAKIDNVFKSPLDSVEFAIENNGELKNGEKAKIILAEDAEAKLIDKGYGLDKDFNATFEVKGLKEVAENAADISNLAEIKDKIAEALKDKNRDMMPKSTLGMRYEFVLHELMYRQYEDLEQGEDFSSTSDGAGRTNCGNLIGIYTVQRYGGGEGGALEAEELVVIGYSDIFLNDKNETNIDEIKSIYHYYYDDKYTSESVIKIAEGYGYSEVK